MKLRNVRKSIVFVVAAGWLALGCELIVDFDRTKIPSDTADATTDVDIDASIDVNQPDTLTPDAADASETSDDGGDASDATDEG